MIDPEVFIQEMLFLEQWTGQNLHSSVQARYAEYLGKHLTTEEFVEASRMIFEQNKSFPFPSVSDFMDKVHQSSDRRAQHEWNKIITYRYNIYEPGYPEGLTPIGYEALKTIKGLHHVHTCPTEQITHLRTAFIHAYKAISARPEEYNLQNPPTALPPITDVFPNPHQPISDDQQALNIEQIRMLRQRIKAQVELPIDPN